MGLLRRIQLIVSLTGKDERKQEMFREVQFFVPKLAPSPRAALHAPGKPV